MEHNFIPNTEQELVELSKKIEARRNQLEKENNIVDQREVVKSVVADTSDDDNDDDETTVKTEQDDVKEEEPRITGVSYIDELDEEKINRIQEKVNIVFDKGLNKGIKEAKKDFSPLELDAFHDVLVDRLYEELKTRGLLK